MSGALLNDVTNNQIRLHGKGGARIYPPTTMGLREQHDVGLVCFFYLEKDYVIKAGQKKTSTLVVKRGNRVSKRVHALFAQQRAGPSRTKNKWVGNDGYVCDYSRRGTHYQRADMCIGGTLLVFCHGACRTNLADIGLWD